MPQDPDWYEKNMIAGGSGYLTKKRVSDDVSMCAGLVWSCRSFNPKSLNILNPSGAIWTFRLTFDLQVRSEELPSDHPCESQQGAEEEASDQLAPRPGSCYEAPAGTEAGDGSHGQGS